MQASVTRGLHLCSKSRIQATKNAQLVFSRANSTGQAAQGTKHASATPASEATLNWPEYLAIRKSKRMWTTVATVPCALLGFAGGVVYFGTQEADPLKPIMGIDPFFFYGLCTMGCVGVGAIVGPTIGSALWRSKNKSIMRAFDGKDSEFYNRVARGRVDASLQSPTQPVPDYYGEKIGSLHQYRQWLRDQAKYRRKALLPEEL